MNCFFLFPQSLKDSADRLKDLENEHQSTLQQLQNKQSQLHSLQQVIII